MEKIQDVMPNIIKTLESLRKGIVKVEKENKNLYPTYRCKFCHDKKCIKFFGIEHEGFGYCDCEKKPQTKAPYFFEIRVKNNIPDVWYLDCDNRKDYRAYDRKTFDINTHLILLRFNEMYQTRRKSLNLIGFLDKNILICENCEKMLLKLNEYSENFEHFSIKHGGCFTCLDKYDIRKPESFTQCKIYKQKLEEM